ncbi:hypothetical protein ACFPRL_18190 [Pseudoclavibacter helvolus]
MTRPIAARVMGSDDWSWVFTHHPSPKPITCIPKPIRVANTTSANHGAARRQSCSPDYASGCTPARCSTVYR